MPRKKDSVKGGAPLSRIRDNTRLMHTHESRLDYISGRHSASSILDIFASGLFGLDFLRTYSGELENDLVYSDDDYDDDDEDDDHFYPYSGAHNATGKHLEPHPRIRQLTDEEADKHAKELIEEEERRKDKTEKNKRKKMRKKEKKRLEKKNAIKDVLPEEDQGKSDSSENQEENPVIESNAKANEPPESGQTLNGTAAAGCDENSANYKEESLAAINKTEEVEEQKVLALNNSCASTTKSEPGDKCNQRPARDRKTKKNKLLEVQQSKEEKPKVAEKPEITKKMEEKHEPSKQEIADPVAEELAKRSRDLAGVGNRLAGSGQYKMAVKCFTDAIKYNPKELKLFGNRSLCYERLQQYENALRDADLALSMEPNWIKGLFRKGKALCGLKRYYEATLIYKEVLKLESSSAEAMQELKRAQTLHLMEMGFTWAQSSEALKTHATLEEAVEALFGDSNPGPGDAGASGDNADQPAVQEEDDDEGEWIVRQTSRPRTQQVKEADASIQSRSKSPTLRSKNSVKPDIFSVWIGSLAPAVTYATLHELFSRAGTVHSIKMLLEHQCAFVNYTRKEDCDRAIKCINGMVVEGAPLSVRYPNKFLTGLGLSRPPTSDPLSHLNAYKKECFFWRTTGCTRQDCTFRHLPEHRGIDRDKFTSRLGSINM